MDLSDQRVLFSDNGTLIDYSVELGDFRVGEKGLAYVTTEDYLYIGSPFPFNHKYIDVGTVNANASTLSVHIWFHDSWKPVVDLHDRTSVSGVSLAQSGIVSWTTDRNEGWEKETDSFDVSGLETTVNVKEIYEMYWVRLSWSADLSGTTTIKYLGHKFSNDDELYSYYPDLSQSALLDSYESGKTNWNEQAFVSALKIIKDLKGRRIIVTGDQILDFDILREPSIHRVAELIYLSQGEAFAVNAKAARISYDESINVGFIRADLNSNARIDQFERGIQVGRMKR